jgi:hypothetical protein
VLISCVTLSLLAISGGRMMATNGLHSSLHHFAKVVIYLEMCACLKKNMRNSYAVFEKTYLCGTNLQTTL